MVLVKYTGKRLPWTIRMPWLSVPEVTFGESRQAEMVEADAIRLCAENPTDWKIIGSVEVKPEKPKPPKPSPPSKKRKAKGKKG